MFPLTLTCFILSNYKQRSVELFVCFELGSTSEKDQIQVIVINGIFSRRLCRWIASNTNLDGDPDKDKLLSI